MILLNRSTAPVRAAIDWPGARFIWAEAAGPYDENSVRPAGDGPYLIPPGELLTLTNVPLGSASALSRSAPPCYPRMTQAVGS